MARSEKGRLSEFIRSEYRKLLGFVRLRLDDIAAQDAEDFVHDVVVRLFDKADITVPIEHLSAYVYRSLQNRIADYFRTKRRAIVEKGLEPENELQTLSQVAEASGYNSASEIRRMEIAHDLYRLLDNLGDDERALIIATDIQGYTFRQLSEKWAVPVNTLLARKSRALKKIRRQIQAAPLQEEIKR